MSYDACMNSMGTSVHDARVNSGRRMNPDACARTNSCSWAHAHGGGPWNEDSEAVFREPGWATCRQYCSTYSERGVEFTAAAERGASGGVGGSRSYLFPTQDLGGDHR